MENEENKHKERQGFPSSIERCRENKFFLGELCPFNTFVMSKTTVSKYRLIKVGITHMCTKPEVKK